VSTGEQDLDLQLEKLKMAGCSVVRAASAPSFKSFSQMVPQVALASLVPSRAMRRTAHTRTYAIEANHSRNWLACS
jgi:hypothetical protein